MSCNRVTIIKLAKLIHNLVVIFPALTLGPLLYRHLEKVKLIGLKYHYNNFDKKIEIPDGDILEIQCWINNIDNACHHTFTSSPYIQLYADSNFTGPGIMSSVWHYQKEKKLTTLTL